MDRVPDSPPYPGGIVKDQHWWNTTYEFKDILQPLADAFSRFPAKHLAETVITVGEGHGKVFFPDEFPALVKISFSEIDLRGTRIPYQLKVCFFCPDGAAFFHVTLDNTVAAGIAMFLNQPFINTPGGMMLFAPVLLILIQPFLYHRLERIQFGRLLLNNRRHWREILL